MEGKKLSQKNGQCQAELGLLHWRQILDHWAIREAPPDSGRHSINICKIELSCKNKAKISKHPQHQPRVHSIFLLVLTRCKLSFPDLNKDGLLQIPEMSKLVGLSSHLIHPCPQLHRMRYWGSRREKAIQSHAQEEWQSHSQASQIPGKLKMDKWKSGCVWGTQMLGLWLWMWKMPQLGTSSMY